MRIHSHMHTQVGLLLVPPSWDTLTLPGSVHRLSTIPAGGAYVLEASQNQNLLSSDKPQTKVAL